ncbi:CBS domain-containing protein [Nocardiopsis sediminis]|uniref:CBS domain-containing protein n=1 Tax=Nocardiopsis sediminis TaxID=1778267 RepID=A0ABV8FJW2_9ACTN
MTTAADLMHSGVRWISDTETLDRVAELMRDMNVGAMPVSDSNDRMCGIITDRDIVVACIAAGRDPSQVTAKELCKGTPRWTTTDSGVSEVLQEMQSHQIRRLPVIDGDKRLVGMISESDLAGRLPEEQIAAFVGRIYAD